jgi:hypothetical protein
LLEAGRGDKLRAASVANSSRYRFRFFRAGGVDQVDLADEEALSHLDALDRKLWVALACPIEGLEIDGRSLGFIDTDGDGRIRPPEILAAIAWAKEAFTDLSGFFDGKDELSLGSFSKKTETGRAVHDAARRILTNLGRPDDDVLHLADVTNVERVFEQTTLNGDGIVPVDAANDEPTRKAIGDILEVMGSVRDRSGKPGIDQGRADAFFEQIAFFATWLGKASGSVRILGDATEGAFEAMTAVRAKVDDYFVRARLLALDERLVPALDASCEEVQALRGVDLSTSDLRVLRLPLAEPAAGRALPLRGEVNPAWSVRMEEFTRLTVDPLLGAGHEALTESDWIALQRLLLPYAAWMAEKPNVPVATLGAERVLVLASGESAKNVSDLIAQDLRLEAECSRMEAVEKAIRLRRDLVPLLRNFVNFADFYGKRHAAFQVGTLYIDGRSCDLCLPVREVGKHALLAGLARAYLVYCECSRKKDAEKRTIVAAVTAGGVDNLMVGRNGVFYDHHGDDWDATIIKIVDNPTSVREAIWSPYKRFARAIEEHLTKRAASADTKAGQSLEETTGHAIAGDPEKAPASPPKPVAKGIDVGTVAAIGVAVGGIATFFSSMLATFLGLGMWLPFGLLALLLAISGPSMLIAWLKLSQRNIGPILDANGWAVNAFARINVPFGHALTKVAELPLGARRILDDPFAEKRRPYRTYLAITLLVALVLAWAFGAFDGILPEKARAPFLWHAVFATFTSHS